MNKIYKISTFLLGALFILSLNSCSDNIDPEITEVNASRLFSPTDLKVRIQNKTSARVEWVGVNKAESYSLEFYLVENEDDEISGTPVKSIEGIVMDEVPYIVSDFLGESIYIVRVKAISSIMPESNWTSISFKTDKEQILQNIPQANIEANQVIINWPAGQIATKIVITPGDITHNLTAAEIEAGEAIVTGLTGETEYVAQLFNGEKVRGTMSFVTPIDLGGAIQVNPEDDFIAIIEAANSGDKFALMPGVYDVNTNVNISAAISIFGAKPSDVPVINGASLKLKESATVNLSNLILDGTGNEDGNQLVSYDVDSEIMFPTILIENCEIRNYVKGIFYVNKKVNIESVTFKGNIIYDIVCDGGDFIDMRKGLTESFLFENNTVYNSANTPRDLFRMDKDASDNFPSVKSIITIKNNTFYNVANSEKRRFSYVRLADNEISFIKNIIAETEALNSNQSATNIVEYKQNNYYNAPNFHIADEAGKYHIDTSENLTLNDPGFANPENGDFTINNEDLIYEGIGDPRWIK